MPVEHSERERTTVDNPSQRTAGARGGGGVWLFVIAVVLVIAVLAVALFWRSAWWVDELREDVGGYGQLLHEAPAPGSAGTDLSRYMQAAL